MGNGDVGVISAVERFSRLMAIGSGVSSARSAALEMLESGELDGRLEERDMMGHTPAMIASEHGCPLHLKLLLEKGAAPCALDRHGFPSLFKAVKAGSIECVELLCAAGADPSWLAAQGLDAFEVADMEIHGRERRQEMLELLAALDLRRKLDDGLPKDQLVRRDSPRM